MSENNIPLTQTSIDDSKNEWIMKGYLQEASEIRMEIAKIQEYCRRITFSSMAIVGGILPVVISISLSSNNKPPPPIIIFNNDHQLLELLLMSSTFVLTLLCVAYLGHMRNIIRLSGYHASHLHPAINEMCGQPSRQVYYWETYLRKKERASLIGLIDCSFYIVSELGAMLAFVAASTCAWIMAAEKISTLHYMTLSYLSIFFIVLIVYSTIIVRAGRQPDRNPG